MTRREINLTFPLMMAALLAEGSSSILKADAPSVRQGAQHHMRNMAPDALR